MAMMLEVGSSKQKLKPPPPRILVATARLALLCVARRCKALL